jgi:hypothetical protein
MFVYHEKFFAIGSKFPVTWSIAACFIASPSVVQLFGVPQSPLQNAAVGIRAVFPLDKKVGFDVSAVSSKGV